MGFSMSTKKPSRKDLLSSTGEITPDDGQDPHIFLRKTTRKPTNRKALQLSGQVMETLNYALAWECGDPILQDLTIDSVTPAPNSTHLLVTVRLPAAGDGPKADVVLEHLQRASGKLRAEVAAAIHRKRVPELTFRVARQ
jgi:ribosome-binding factor A